MTLTLEKMPLVLLATVLDAAAGVISDDIVAVQKHPLK